MEYLKQINQEIYDYENKSIPIVPGLTFNQKETIEQIYFYYLSKFKTGEIDLEGDKKYFFNINRNPCKVMTKMIDFDTKHIRILTASGTNPLVTWFFERDLKYWMKDKNFGKVLNRIFQDLPIFGSVVLKMVKNTPYFVDLRNFVINPTADTLGETPIIERHFYTPDSLRKIGKDLGWENIEQAIDEYRKQEKKGKYIMVYERYGEIASLTSKGETEISNRRIVLADVGVDKRDEYQQSMIAKAGVVLKDEEYEGHPYYEFHLEKIPGRWLGLGVVESLFDPQIRQNELANQMSKGTYWASLRLFQTAGEAANLNLSTDVTNGQVLGNDGFPFTPIDLTERNLAYFNQEFTKWLQNRDELTFAYDVVQGERLPAGTPLGSANLAATMASNYFEQIQENIALDVKELLYNEIIPNFKKENSTEHVLRLVGEDLNTYNEMLLGIATTDEVVSYSARKGVPGQEALDLIKATTAEMVKQGKERILNIPSDFYKNLKYKIDIEITGEARDIRVWAATLFAALQAMTADPTLLTDPAKRKLFSKWLEAGGLNIGDIEPPKQQDVEALIMQQATKPMPTSAPRGAGGGVSKPAMTQNPMAGNQTAQL